VVRIIVLAVFGGTVSGYADTGDVRNSGVAIHHDTGLSQIATLLHRTMKEGRGQFVGNVDVFSTGQG
jgi:hypothetical protein